MAKITSIKRNYTKPTKIRPHSDVDAELIEIDEDTVQIDTFGTKKRKKKGVQSQTIRISKNAAKDLIEMFKNIFKL